MKRILALAVMFTMALSAFSPLAAQAQVGVIAGTLSGPSGPLAGVTVNVVNAAGTIVGSATTTAAGGFNVAGLVAGSYSVQAVSATGAVLSTSTATLAAGAMTATVSMTATAAAVAGAAAGAGAGAAAATAGISTAVVVGGAAAAATAIGVGVAVANNDDASASR